MDKHFHFLPLTPFFSLSLYSRFWVYNRATLQSWRWSAHLKSLDDLPDVFFKAFLGWEHNTFATFIEYLNVHDGGGPAYHITTGAVEDHIFWLRLHQHNELIGDAKQTLDIQWLAEIPCHHTPHNGSYAVEVGIPTWYDTLFFLASQCDEAELQSRVHSRCAPIILSKVFKVLLACSSSHSIELLWLVCCILTIDYLSKQEVPEDGWLGECHPFRNWRTK